MDYEEYFRQARKLQELMKSIPQPPRITIDPSILEMAREAQQLAKSAPDLSHLNRSIIQSDIIESTQRMAAMLDQARLSPILAAIETQRKQLEIWKQSERGLIAFESDAKQLGSAGWTIPGWAPIDFCQRILTHIPHDQPGKLDRFFVRHYSKDKGKAARELFEELLAAPGLEQWHSMLTECISCYRRRQYLVVVPSLLLIFEGAVARATKQTAIRIKEPLATVRANSPIGTGWLFWVSIEAFAQALYMYFPFAGDPPSMLNRHWALHGRERPEYTKADCLKLFQAIHTIAPAANTQDDDEE